MSVRGRHAGQGRLLVADGSLRGIDSELDRLGGVLIDGHEEGVGVARERVGDDGAQRFGRLLGGFHDRPGSLVRDASNAPRTLPFAAV